MAYEDLIQLITHLDATDVAYIDYKTEKQHVILSKEVPQINSKQEAKADNEASQNLAAPTKEPTVNVQTDASEEATETVKQHDSEESSEKKDSEAVKSPMVGVVYLQPQPDEEVYVKVGDRVEQGDVVCIVEAMKLMNEIQAPHGGIVTEIAVENEDVVEFNQPLIYIEP